jgi:CBS domain-containing protein
MTIVSQILQGKGNQIWSVSPDATVYETLELMAEKNIGAVLVLEDDQSSGIFSERDYARKVILQGKSSRQTPIVEVMSSPVISVRPGLSVDKCMRLMTDRKFRHLPVVTDEGQLVGIISIGDVVNALINEQEIIINHLEDYITGKIYETPVAAVKS